MLVHVFFERVIPQVLILLGSTAKHGRTILQFAAQSGNKEGFEAVLGTVKGLLPGDKVGSSLAATSYFEDSHERMAQGYWCFKAPIQYADSMLMSRCTALQCSHLRGKSSVACIKRS